MSRLFGKMGRTLQSKVNSALGKQVTKESEEMLAMFNNLSETKKNFKELQKVFDSVFARATSYDDAFFQQYPANPETPAGKSPVPYFQVCAEFYAEIKKVEDLIEEYEKTRQRYDDASNLYNGKVSSNKSQEEQEKFLNLMNEAKQAYDDARVPVEDGCADIEARKEAKHVECLQVLAQMLQLRIPTWKHAEKAAAAAPEAKSDGAQPEGDAAAASEPAVEQQGESTQ